MVTMTIIVTIIKIGLNIVNDCNTNGSYNSKSNNNN